MKKYLVPIVGAVALVSLSGLFVLQSDAKKSGSLVADSVNIEGVGHVAIAPTAAVVAPQLAPASKKAPTVSPVPVTTIVPSEQYVVVPVEHIAYEDEEDSYERNEDRNDDRREYEWDEDDD